MNTTDYSTSYEIGYWMGFMWIAAWSIAIGYWMLGLLNAVPIKLTFIDIGYFLLMTVLVAPVAHLIGYTIARGTYELCKAVLT